MDPHDVTIFPLFDKHWHKSSSMTMKVEGCLDTHHVIEAVLPEGAYIDSVNKAISKRDIQLDPGFYLMLEYVDSEDEFMGLVFTVTPGGKAIPLCQGASGRVVSWPPKGGP